MATVAPEQAILYRKLLERRLCTQHPAPLLERVECIDATTGETFKFSLLTDEERQTLAGIGWDQERDPGWFWQRELLDEWLTHPKSVCLKARQLGITWLGSGLALWVLLYKPGSKVLAVSIKESEASKLVNRVYDMLQSLPEHLLNNAEVIKPARGARPSNLIELRFPDGRISSIEGLTSSPSAGHGVTAALVLLDEFSRQEYASETWKAVLPTTQGGGRVVVISTGNGISDGKGGGNFFHHVWSHADELGVKPRFLRWDRHPKRDDEWYRREAMALPPADRGEQYPADPEEAFILSGSPFFDRVAMAWYRKNAIIEPLERFEFQETGKGQAKRVKRDDGAIRVLKFPQTDGKYAVGADTASGSGLDYSCAYVIDLQNMELCAEFHVKTDADLFAEQLHYLGRWYNTALIAVEVAGGHGDAVIVSLRDGRKGRPAYPKLYRHIMSSRPDFQEAKPYGFPTNSKTRPLITGGLEAAIREKALPGVTNGLLIEMATFVRKESGTSPAAQSGTNDDRVMACAITLEMYRLYGHHPLRDRKRSRRLHKTLSELRNG